MFHRLSVILNELRNLVHKVDVENFSHRFLRCLPPRFDTLVTIIMISGLKEVTQPKYLVNLIFFITTPLRCGVP
jgi:uncharacterized membrane protein SirB2